VADVAPAGGSTQRIKGFDGLRALAVLAVFLQHYTTFGRNLHLGSYGVWLFFALSGFLIVRILQDERQAIASGTTTHAAALARFFWRRALRLMPIYYLVLVVFTVMSALHWVRDFPLGDAWWHYAWLSNHYFGQVLGEWTGRFGYLWSLAVEQQFYLLAAPAILFAPVGWARPLCGALAIAALAQSPLLWAGGATPIEIYTNSLLNFGVMALGGLVGLSTPAVTRDGDRSWPVLACFAGVAVVGGSFWFMGAVPRPTAALIGGLPLAATAVLGSLALASVHQNQASRLVGALEWAPLAYLGKISYGFYLFHNLPPHWMITGLSARLGLPIRAPESLEALLNFAVALALAALSWRLIERPLARLKDRPQIAEALAVRWKAATGGRRLEAAG
jgi:peptidoglycan/LPS O-acetylase OafA/YrhL